MSRYRQWFIIILVWLNILLWTAVFGALNPGLEVTFFDVGEGDSVFIETPRHYQIVVDGGPSSTTLLKKINQELPFWDRHLDLMVLTHPDKDHLAGLLPVFKYYEVEKVLWTGVVKETAIYQEWREVLEESGSEVIIAEEDQDLESPQVYFDVLYPFLSFNRQTFSDYNGTSVVMKVVYQGGQFLLTGDISETIENKLIREEVDLQSDILKVAHHGSQSSTGRSFLNAVRPQMAVISVGENSYGHPDKAVLNRLKDYGITTLRTDQEGDIKIKFNNQK